MSVKNNDGEDKPAADSEPIKPLDEKGVLSIFTQEEVEEMRRELAKRSKAIKRRRRADA